VPTSEHGYLDNPKKSAYSIEFYDSTWEKEYMKKLENNPEIKGTHFLNNPITKKKFEAADKYCKARKMSFKIISKYQ
jgi:hypothetical protein